MFGIDKKTREYALNKIDKQKEFLSKHYFDLGSQKVSMLDMVKNAYFNNDRYISEVNHRVYSLYNYANNRGLKNLFGTITLPSEYHSKVGNNKNNPKYCNKHLLDDKNALYCPYRKIRLLDYENYNPKAGARRLSKMFKSLLDLRILRNIGKEDRCYFRVYEPHKDGTPHLHFSLFIPEDKLHEVQEKFYAYFKKKYPGLKVDFQININNPVAYLMKYILKTFDDLRDDKSNFSDLTLWYITHRITRFYTSRTLISLNVFRPLNGRYNLLELTKLYNDNELTVLLEPITNKVLTIYDGAFNIYSKPSTIVYNIDKSIKLDYKKRKSSFKEPPIIIDGLRHTIFNGKLELYKKNIPVSKMKSDKLYFHYEDMENGKIDFDLKHYGLVKNELINRKLIEGEIISLNKYNTDFDF